MVKIQATGGLLVPRADAFWHVGTHIVRSTQDPNSNYDEQFWAVPAGELPKSPEADPQIDGTAVRMITYAGPEYVAYLFHWQGGAGAWEYVYPHVVSLKDPATETTVAKILGPAADTEYKHLAKSLDHMNDEHKEGEDRDACDCCTGDQKEWGILHVENVWQAYPRFQYGPSSSCSQGSEDRVLRATIPRSLAAGGTLNRSWDVLRAKAETVSKSEPGSVRHLFVSPKNDIAVAVGTNGLMVLGVENLHIVSILKTQKFEVACIPVMEQWSIGRYVAEWDAAIQKEHSAEMPRTVEP